MRAKPYRPSDDISQTYEDGIVEIFRTLDKNLGTGLISKEELVPIGKLAYQERRLGVQRYYNAMQNRILVQRVIRVPKSNHAITNQDIAITEDGKQYRIDLVQAVTSYPPSYDLTLVSRDSAGGEEEIMDDI